ncbi:tRNA lysidine(34) synthetase TilS [Pseudomonas akapageensis]|uniref:tRNA lysidine(34) synthetase TilS n=1 Tax=Pseudomonas akapageensis TaxID=2609961 RepID=UPI001407E6B4|nr:tRNA lysidine(34) synthetase TilS [Pseudomonas akapageensis]
MQTLHNHLLTALAPWRNAPAWHIALSGGLDSTVLLHLLADLAQQHPLPPLHVIHVHHGLQAAADAWPDHCRALCAALHLPLQVVQVQVEAGASVEQQAREARYRAFEQVLQADEVLLTGQHREDQAETLLFRLLRGAGLRGLTAMPGHRPLGRGHLVRPLLEVSRSELLDYARTHSLSWIEDPSNTDTRYSRNFLRHQIFPALAERWSQAATNMARSAGHLSEAQGLLDEVAEQDLGAASTSTEFAWLALPSLALAPLQQLSPARQRNALQYWLSAWTRLPDSRHWVGWDNLRDTGEQGRPIWRLTDGELHRAGGRLWWLSGVWLQPPGSPLDWPDPSQPLLLPGNGTLWFSGILPQGRYEIRYRQGGEVLLQAQRGQRDLKRLLNEWGLPLFARARLPLLYRDGQLQAVANLPGTGEQDWQLHWKPPTSEQRLR